MVYPVDRRAYRTTGARADFITCLRWPAKPSCCQPQCGGATHRTGISLQVGRRRVEVGNQEAASQGTILQVRQVCLQLPAAMYSGKPGSGMASHSLDFRKASGQLSSTLKGHKTQSHRWKENIEDFINSSSASVNYINFLIIIDCSRLPPEQTEVSVLRMTRST